MFYNLALTNTVQYEYEIDTQDRVIKVEKLQTTLKRDH